MTELNIGDYHVRLWTNEQGTVFIDFDRLDNEPDKAEPLVIILNDETIFDGTK